MHINFLFIWFRSLVVTVVSSWPVSSTFVNEHLSPKPAHFINYASLNTLVSLTDPGFFLSGIGCFCWSIYMLSLLFQTPCFCTSRPRIHLIRRVDKEVENVWKIQFSFLNEMHEVGLTGHGNLNSLFVCFRYPLGRYL